MHIQNTSFALLVCSLACLAGCNSEVGTVSGRVTFDGQPVKHASVYFQPKDGGRASTAITDDDGNYKLMYKVGQPGAKVGTHVVKITTAWQDDDKNINRAEFLPAKYHANSNLTKEVKAGHNTFDFPLTSK